MTTCPNCGKELGPDAVHGLCPACLLQAGLGSGVQPCASTVASETVASPAGPAVPLTREGIAEKFPQLEILELLGKGGMGVVYKARQPQLDRLVALKILPTEIARTPGFAERFALEARALARLSHPNIVTIHDSGQVGGLYYFIMEYVDGANLRQLITDKKLPAETALAIVPKICEALQFAHDEGILHRDIKPENILLDRKGRVKIADFGLAKLTGADDLDHGITHTGMSMGTPRYMAPEQFNDTKGVDHRADIYSLGVVFYEMLTGQLPIGRFPLPSKTLHVDVRLDEVVLRTLEQEPALRYQHASEVKTDVENITRFGAMAPPSSQPKRDGGTPPLHAPPATGNPGETNVQSPEAPPPGRLLGLRIRAWLLIAVSFALAAVFVPGPGDLPAPKDAADIFQPVLLVTPTNGSYHVVSLQEARKHSPVFALTTVVLSDQKLTRGLGTDRRRGASFGFFHRSATWTYRLGASRFGDWKGLADGPMEIDPNEVAKLRPLVVEELNQRGLGRGGLLVDVLDNGRHAETVVCWQNAVVLAAWIAFILLVFACTRFLFTTRAGRITLLVILVLVGLSFILFTPWNSLRTRPPDAAVNRDPLPLPRMPK